MHSEYKKCFHCGKIKNCKNFIGKNKFCVACSLAFEENEMKKVKREASKRPKVETVE